VAFAKQLQAIVLWLVQGKYCATGKVILCAMRSLYANLLCSWAASQRKIRA
jgi:hypothetical protein